MDTHACVLEVLIRLSSSSSKLGPRALYHSESKERKKGMEIDEREEESSVLNERKPPQ